MSGKRKSDIEYLLNPTGRPQRAHPPPTSGASSSARPPPSGTSARGAAVSARAGASSARPGSSSRPALPASSAGSSDRPFRCSQCDRAFRERGNLNKHVLSVHQKQKSHTCAQCGKSFAFRDGLLRHISHVHQNERRYTCEICQRQFKQLSHLAKHRKSIHKIDPWQVIWSPELESLNIGLESIQLCLVFGIQFFQSTNRKHVITIMFGFALSRTRTANSMNEH